MRCKKFLCVIFVSFLPFSLGCARLQVHSFVKDSQRPAEYTRFYALLDQTVRQSDVRDAADFPLLGFPYLRTDRFSLGIEERLKNESQKNLWIEFMRQQDLKGRIKEIQNLPDDTFRSLAQKLNMPPNREAFIEKLSFYSEKLREHDSKQLDFYESVKKATRDAGEYSFLRRAIGIYPVFYFPVKFATEKSYKKFKQWHSQPISDLPVLGKMTIYTPHRKINFPVEKEEPMAALIPRNALGMPQLDFQDIDKLAWGLAPVFFQDVVSDYDQFGRVEWQDSHLTINTQKPAVYYYVSYAWIKGEPVIQLNYVVWYQGRLGPNAPWMERGPLDGLTVRITLDTFGWPIMMDVMNNCGCYHFFVPRKEKIKRIKSQAFGVSPLVPTWLLASFPQKRINLRVNSGWHQVQHITASDFPKEALDYDLIPYEALESLPHADGQRESAFDSKGIMKDSWRLEPWIFFSMGIPQVGFMRQRGHHAIKLLGRVHFTDPDLFDRTFVFK